jgi:uncharacterized iron-regulated membrane protein
MNLLELQRILLAAARNDAPSETVPYAFEKRVMARIATQPVVDLSMLWNRILWRATAPCIAIMILLGVWTMLSAYRNGPTETLAADLENTVLAPFDNLGETW